MGVAWRAALETAFIPPDVREIFADLFDPTAMRLAATAKAAVAAYQGGDNRTASLAAARMLDLMVHLANFSGPDGRKRFEAQTGMTIDSLRALVTAYRPDREAGKAAMASYNASGADLVRKALGGKADEVRGRIAAAKASHEAAAAAYEAWKAEQTAEIKRRVTELRESTGVNAATRAWTEIRQLNSAKMQAARNDGMPKAEFEALREALNAEDSVLLAERERIFTAVFVPATEALAAEGQAARDIELRRVERLAADAAAIARDAMGPVKNALLQASPVTQEEAEVWAAAQVVDEGVIALLRRQKPAYPERQLRSDMAEFYRLTGGRLGRVRLMQPQTMKGRAHANVDGEVVYVTGAFPKATLFHEMGHPLERDRFLRGVAKGFVESRATGGTRRLKDMTGNSGYKSKEVAVEADVFHPYVAKVYDSGVSEVWSMGLQQFASLEEMAFLFDKDPGMFEMMAGAMASITPAERERSLALNTEATRDTSFYAQAAERSKAMFPLDKAALAEKLSRWASSVAVLSRVNGYSITKHANGFNKKGDALKYTYGATRDMEQGPASPNYASKYFNTVDDAMLFAYVDLMTNAYEITREKIELLIIQRVAPSWFEPGDNLVEMEAAIVQV